MEGCTSARLSIIETKTGMLRGYVRQSNKLKQLVIVILYTEYFYIA